jgi:hypothetical protein
MSAAFRKNGIDARLALFIPLATVASVLLTSFFYALLAAIADYNAFLPILYAFAFGGLVTAAFALPLSMPLSLAAWTLVFGLFRRRGLDESRTAAIAAALSGLAGAAGFALWTTSEVAPGIFLLVLPGTLAGSVFAARLLCAQTGGAPA